MKFPIRTVILLSALVPLPSIHAAQRPAVTSTMAHGIARSALDEVAGLVIKKKDLITALGRLSETSGVSIAFSPSLVRTVNRDVSCECRDVTVRTALDRLLTKTGLGYSEQDRQVLIGPRPGVDGPASAPVRPTLVLERVAAFRTAERPFLLTSPFQGRVVRGTVVDERDRPINGARVAIVGSATVGVTDGDGRFALDDVREPEVTLRITAIGFVPLSRSVRADDPAIRIMLTASAIKLDEVIVTGTPGATQRRAVANAVGRIDAAALREVAPVQGMAQVLNARVPGVIVMGDLGVIGSGPRVRMRGRTSISLKSDPIIYIDGIRVSNSTGTGPAYQGANVTSRLADIDPGQVESIEIIKGPAAATLYGTEASNGVIQIITKRGAFGERPTLALAVRQGAAWFMDPEGRIQQNFSRDPTTGEIVGPYNVIAQEREAGRKLFQTGHQQSYDLGLSGGSDVLRYNLNGIYTRDEAAEPDNKAARISGRSNIDVRPMSGLDINGSLGFIRQRYDLPLAESANCAVCKAMRAEPRWKDTPFLGFRAGPPYAIRESVSWWQEIDRYIAGLQVNHVPAEWLTHRLALGLDQTAENDVLLAQLPPDPSLIPIAQWRAGHKVDDRRLIAQSTVDYGATAKAALTGTLRSSTSVGFQYYRTRTRFSRAEGRNFPSPGLSAVNAAAVTLAQEELVENATVGVYLQEQLSLSDRLFITGAIRADDNTAFGKDFDAVIYPKVSASWVISEEPFWGIGVISQLKLRAAYGQSGQQPEAFAALQTYAATTGPGGAPALTPGLFGNDRLGPERGEEIEAGLEAGLFGGRVGIDFTYYNKRTKDAILLRQIAPSSGFLGSQFMNAGLITNTGIELMVNAVPIESRSVTWDLSLNVGTNRNTIVDLDPNDPSLTFIPTDMQNRMAEGYPISGHFKQKVVSAVYSPATGRMENIMCDGGTGPRGLELGGSPVPCDDAPMLYLGHAEPSFTGQVTNSLSFGDRWQIRALLDFKGGNRIFFHDGWVTCASYLICEGSPGLRPEAVDPLLAAEMQIGADNRAVSQWVSKADFIKLRELSVSYLLPNTWARAIKASRARVTVAGRNLHTWTGYIGLDPEAFRPNRLEAAGGYTYRDQGSMPGLASVQFMVNLTW